MRLTDFLRTAVLLFGGAATALAIVSIAGANAKDDVTLVYVAGAWWGISALVGLWLGRRRAVTEGIGRLLASARAATHMPELEPGTIIFNRLWPLFVVTLGSGTVAFLLPQVPAIATGYALIVALAWRKQSSAVEAIEMRDGVQFHVERTSPFRPTQLLRTAGLRKLDPQFERDAERT